MSEVVAVAAGKGGVGKSTVSALLGRALAEMGQRVLLLETGSGLRSLDIMLGVRDAVVYDLGDIISRRCEPAKAIIPVGEASLHLISAPANADFILEEKNFTVLVKGFQTYYQYILIDTPGGMGQQFRASVAPAGKGLLVATPDDLSARSAGQALQLMDRLGVMDFALVINKLDPAGRLTLIPDLDYIIDTVGARLLGVVPASADIHQAAAAGIPLPDCKSREVFAAVASRLMGRYVPLLVE